MKVGFAMYSSDEKARLVSPYHIRKSPHTRAFPFYEKARIRGRSLLRKSPHTRAFWDQSRKIPS
jgi:hypothetical protein